MCTVRLVNFVYSEKINCDYLKIKSATKKMIGRLLANDCRFRDFTLSLKTIQFVGFIARLSYTYKRMFIEVNS